MARLENVGFVHFDIPDKIKRFANRLRKSFRRGRALPASMSCYIVNWPDSPAINAIYEAAKKEYVEKYPEDEHTINGLIINVLKMDDATAEEAGRMAVEGLTRMCGQIQGSLTKQLKKMKKEGEDELPRRLQVGFCKKMQEALNLAVAFGLMEDVEVALEAMQTAVVAQIGAKVAAKYMKPSETVGAGK